MQVVTNLEHVLCKLRDRELLRNLKFVLVAFHSVVILSVLVLQLFLSFFVRFLEFLDLFVLLLDELLDPLQVCLRKVDLFVTCRALLICGSLVFFLLFRLFHIFFACKRLRCFFSVLFLKLLFDQFSLPLPQK